MNATFELLGPVWTALAGHLWQTTMVLGLVSLLALRLRHAPAGLLYSLWAAAFLKALLPLALFGRLAEELVLKLDPALRAPSAAGLAALGGILDPVTILGARGLGAGWLLRSLPAALTLTWMAGAAVGIRALIRSCAQSGRLGQRPASTLGPSQRDTLEAALAGTSIGWERILVSPRVSIPCVIGFARPRILLPAPLPAEWSPEELRALLLHEQEHCRRREPLRSAVLSFCSSLCCFYPLLALVRRRLDQAAELICDEAVLRHGIHPGVYARALARAVQMSLAMPAGSGFALAGAPGPNLKTRLQRIREHGRYVAMNRHYLTIVLAVGLIALGTFLPLQLLTGCDRERAARDSVVQPASAPAARAAATAADEPQTTEPNVTASRDAGAAQDQATSRAEAEKPAPSVDEMPVLLHIPAPAYPPEARARGIEGTVGVRAKVGTDGKVADEFVAQHADPSLEPTALAAVRQATFKPAMKDGRPVEVWVFIPIKFALK